MPANDIMRQSPVCGKRQIRWISENTATSEQAKPVRPAQMWRVLNNNRFAGADLMNETQ